ncbi:MAG: histidine triad nucleotide-binding protein [Clostridia bacterium]|nr:histidine triad nucleotide-binding protein [Clostridia bacterium]
MDNCIFCKIINKEIPSTVVYEDDRVLAFKDIQPVAPVHVLIVPKKHIPSVKDIQPGEEGYLVDIHKAAVKIAQELGIAENGFRLINNCGKGGGQTVFHLHYHLIGGAELGAKLI